MSASPYIFDGPDADVVLRAPLQPGSQEFKDFHVHKLILSIASTVFQDILSIPQPPRDTSEGTATDIVQVTESAEVLEAFLQLIYPVDPPVIKDLRLVEDLLEAADKYMAKGVSTKLKKRLVSLLRDDPIGVFAIACRNNLDEEARLALSHTFSFDIINQISETHLQIMTAGAYHRLLTEHIRRGKQLVDAVSGARCSCRCGQTVKKEIQLRMSGRLCLDRAVVGACLPPLGSRGTGCSPHMPCISQTPELRSAFLSDVMSRIQAT